MSTVICCTYVEDIRTQAWFGTAEREKTSCSVLACLFVEYLFSLMYELDVCNVGEPFVADECRDAERIKLMKDETDWFIHVS